MQSLLKLAGNSLGTLQSTMEMAVPQMFPMLPGNLRALPQGMEAGNSILFPSICCISVQWQLYMMQMRHSSGNKASTSVSLTVTIVFVVTEITTDTNFSFSTWYIDIVFHSLASTWWYMKCKVPSIPQLSRSVARENYLLRWTYPELQ